jgi:hypothetical protein
MTILFLLSKSSNNPASFFHQPAKTLIWAMVVIFIVAMALLTSCAFFDTPKRLTDLIHSKPTEIGPQQKETTKKFNIYLAGRPLKGVKVSAANIGRTTLSDSNGMASLVFIADSGLKKLHLNFESPVKNIDTQIDVNLTAFPAEFNLIEKRRVSSGLNDSNIEAGHPGRKPPNSPVMEGYVYNSPKDSKGIENVRVCYPGYCTITDNTGHFAIKGAARESNYEVLVTATIGAISRSGIRAIVNQKDVIIYLEK